MEEIECTGDVNFLGLPEAYSIFEKSYFSIVPVPYDATATYLPGSRMGPRAIIQASQNLELYDHQLDLEPARVGIATRSEVPVLVGDPTGMLDAIRSAVEEVLAAEKLPILLGGEHTVSLGALSALAAREEFALVCLDAHADLRDTYQGSAYSHACYLRRASEMVNCTVLGVRSLSKTEAEYARKAGIGVVYAEAILEGGIQSVDLSLIPEKLYLSIDLDVLDPSIMPSTGTPEPGGLGWYETIGLLERIVSGRRILGFDVVELCPVLRNHASEFTAAKLVHKLMGLILKFSINRGKERTRHAKEKVQEKAAG